MSPRFTEINNSNERHLRTNELCSLQTQLNVLHSVGEGQFTSCFRVNSKASSYQKRTEELIDTQNTKLLTHADT